VLTAVLIAAALAAGITGAWSPCGFSMVETLAPTGYAATRRTTLAACATFALGALAGGVVTFGGLALLGAAMNASAPVAAALIALAAAVGEAKGARIVPQVRRQVPESWRRTLPVPLAAGLYGVLLGLGFTTFILSFAVWALAAISVALADPATGALVGLAFGAGRALPVIALAPSAGGALHAAMAERPRILRSLRALDALTLTAAALALATTPAHAATHTIAPGFADPSVDGTALALHHPGSTGQLWSPTDARPLPGAHPAIGGARVAWTGTDAVVVADLAAFPAPGANAVAISATWVAWRTRQAIYAAPLTGDMTPRVVAQGAVGRPALAGDLLVYALEGRIEAIDLNTSVRAVLRSEKRSQLRGPSIANGRLAYIRATYRRQQVRVGPLIAQPVRRDRAIYGTIPTGRRDNGEERGHEHAPGHSRKQLWQRPRRGIATTLTTTAATDSAVYFTRVRQRAGRSPMATILRTDG
jgi:hypothetical protein